MKRIVTIIACMMISVLAGAYRGHFFSSDRFSSSLISDLCQDSHGAVWIGTDYGLNYFDGYNFYTFLHSDADSTTLNANVVVTMMCDKDGRMWVGTNKGLDLYDHERGIFHHYKFPYNVQPRVVNIIQRRDGTILVGTAGYGIYQLSPDNKNLIQYLPQNLYPFASRLYEDASGRLWFSGFDEKVFMHDGDRVTTYTSVAGTPQAFVEYDGQLHVLGIRGFQVFSGDTFVMSAANTDVLAVNDVVFTSAIKGSDNTIYIGTRGHGLYKMSNNTMERMEITASGIDEATAKIAALMLDRHGNLWIGCHHKGLLMLPQRPMQFGNWSFFDQGYNLGSTISSICEGDNDMVWCTVQGVGVYGFNSLGHIVAHPASPDAVEFIFRDQKQRFWIGTDDGLYSYDPLTGRSSLCINFDCDMFHDMTSDSQGRIYISTFARGFCIYDSQTGELKNHNFHEEADSVKGRLCNNWVMGMSSDADGLIWMATSSGVSCYDPLTDGFRTQGWEVQLNGVVCFDVCELHSGKLPDGTNLKGCIAIGTERGLYLYDRQSRQAKPFPGGEVLQNKVVSYIVQSADGDIWCSTSAGIWQYQLSTHSFIGHVSGNGLVQKEYLYGVGMHTDDDHIFFAHNDGLTVFMPREVKDSHTSDTLKLTAFRVGDQLVYKGTVINDVEVTDRAVSESNYFTLSYLDHTVTMAFSQFNFNDPSNVIFEYKVNGGEWIRNSEGQNEFTLGHLQPGTYRIVVRALQGNEYTPEKVVVVTIRSPWYSSTTAYFIYALLLLSLLAYVFYTYRRRAKQQLDEDKMKFLINATHDIRSPLTLILSPLEKLKNAKIDTFSSQADFQSFNNSTYRPSVETIERNAKRILDLVNQILDVRRIDKQQMHLQCQPTDLVAFARGIYKMYEYNARERNIDFKFESNESKIEAWVDRSQFDKVISNLLSNAFKYCGEEGAVVLRLTQEENSVRLQVIDNGAGLDKDSVKHIFDRFYQGSNSRQLKIKGTGIGLNLCKMIVDMHHGTIDAQNRDDGEQGAVFTVQLPLGNAHLRNEEILGGADNDDIEAADKSTTDTDGKTGGTNVAQGQIQTSDGLKTSSTSGRRRVLVVDDDEEIADYISTELSHYYKFSVAHNGKDGIKELLLGDYDLVISDVMMPEMDGFTMLRMIKTNMNISHIPVIMLTSKADVGNRLEGLERGADAFLAKPFDMDELHFTIDNLIQSRMRLKGRFTGAQQQNDKVEQLEVKGNDEILMERIMKVVNKNLSNSDFNVDMLTQEVGISRAQLHRKMKEMTGISTSEFIRNIRLEQAARLLREQKINVTQVAYTTGFSNLAHFSTIFRKHFGVSPSEYAERT